MLSMWAYLQKVLGNWAGILLAIDAGVALFERYLGDFIERYIGFHLHIPTSIKLSFAIIVFMAAQWMAYQNSQKDLIQAGKDNDGLHTAVNALNSQVDHLQLQISQLKNSPPKQIITVVPEEAKARAYMIFAEPEINGDAVGSQLNVNVKCTTVSDTPARVSIVGGNISR